jgi:hypothetical protein
MAPPAHTCCCRYRSAKLNWHFRPHSPTLFTNTIKPEEGLIIIKAQQLDKSITLRVQAPLQTFSRVGGPTRGGFVPHSVESYSATATAGENSRWCDRARGGGGGEGEGAPRGDYGTCWKVQ